MFEFCHYVSHVLLEYGLLNLNQAGALDPLRVMNTRNWFRLFSISPCASPAIVEKDWDDVMASTFGNCEERKDVVDVLGGVSDVWSDVEENSQFGEADISGPGEFFGDYIKI